MAENSTIPMGLDAGGIITQLESWMSNNDKVDMAEGEFER